MGAVDRHDQMVRNYAIDRKSRRWWVRMFVNFLDAIMVNAYIVYKENFRIMNMPPPQKPPKPLSHDKFMAGVIHKLIGNFSCRRQPGPAPAMPPPPFHGRDHDSVNLADLGLLNIVTSVPAAEDLLSTLNNCHPSIHFTMELASGNKLPFVGMEVLKKGCKLETSVYRKPTNTGLLLHHQSHVDKRYKKSLLKTMLNRAFRLSSTWESFKSECDHLKMMFTNLKYPDHLINSTISHFVTSVRSENPGVQAQLSVNENAVHRVVLPFKDQKSADAVKRQLSDLSNKIDHTLHPVFKSRKICEDLRVREPKPPIVSQQCVVYNYKCDLCDAEYVGYTSRHLHQRINEHRNSAIGKHLKNDHGLQTIGDLTKHFNVLKKCTGKLDCLVHEMLFIKKMKPSLNKQSDSIRAKLFI
ncbi:uncharacterized protein LOC111322317 [Stylophora pistillata]|uniref:uncharacterized protein LOC111322317 n=1 Tax=Stylophora pistillata TaxID=50429 RepID=UPI000C04687E|nr:uncharacterized protein LOC111322317 [Stylophora pistillata]